ncbi:unnamed protein product [Ectocarpus sp. 12 AP-2014]
MRSAMERLMRGPILCRTRECVCTDSSTTVRETPHHTQNKRKQKSI